MPHARSESPTFYDARGYAEPIDSCAYAEPKVEEDVRTEQDLAPLRGHQIRKQLKDRTKQIRHVYPEDIGMLQNKIGKNAYDAYLKSVHRQYSARIKEIFADISIDDESKFEEPSGRWHQEEVTIEDPIKGQEVTESMYIEKRVGQD